MPGGRMKRDGDAESRSYPMRRGRRRRVWAAGAADHKSMVGARPRAAGLALAAACLALAALPGVADAHGPVAPIATSYLARIGQLPAGAQAKVIDGDQRLWLRVSPTETVVVLDYRGAPYLRFSPSGVAVNRNSAMFYFNQTPAEIPPSGLGPATPAKWSRASAGHEYSWHDGRLHALAAVAIAPGTAYVGRWSIPVRVNGAPGVIAGGLWHADDPSLVWFWPIVVLLACTLAARRVHRPELDLGLARGLSVAALVGIAVAGAGRELHGRPAVSVFQMVTLVGDRCVCRVGIAAAAAAAVRILHLLRDRVCRDLGGGEPDTDAVEWVRAGCHARVRDASGVRGVPRLRHRVARYRLASDRRGRSGRDRRRRRV